MPWPKTTTGTLAPGAIDLGMVIAKHTISSGNLDRCAAAVEVDGTAVFRELVRLCACLVDRNAHAAVDLEKVSIRAPQVRPNKPSQGETTPSAHNVRSASVGVASLASAAASASMRALGSCTVNTAAEAIVFAAMD